MDAKKLIKDTFQNPFDKARFVYFIKSLLNTIDESKAFHARGYVPEIFKNYVKTYERIATYTDPQGKKIDILIVYLQKETSLERARTAQRNFIARYLKSRDEKDAGLVAFVPPAKADWRFSFIKMEYKLTKTPKGTVKAKEEFTPARRYSFLVGLNESTHTAQRQLVPILSDDKNNPTLDNLEEAFRIEKVTKEFFAEYRRLFLDVKEALDRLVEKDSKIRKDFKSKNINTVDFAKKLLGQIVFLYFLQKKGWFGVARDADWGTGLKNFLRRLFEKKIIDYKNFFNDILEPLFYEALATERPDNFYSRFNCKIPFLNGGLFDPINNYAWDETDITLPDELFSNDYRTKEGDIGTGILDVFDRYNFTVKEDEPLEKEVAVDPEMLGKVFENLLEVKDRKSKGTYYTPREIVHYMCQESLINYLATELKSKLGKKDIEILIKHGELVNENELLALVKEQKIKAGKQDTTSIKMKLPKSIRKHAELIDEKLASIRICDPAVGSGAFPVGMMSEIVRARNTLTAYIKNKNGRTIYNFKRHAIQNCLYGVDTDPSAVEIAKLRLWLSLIVDEEDIKQIKPLPNLDYKIMQGNSLIELLSGNFLSISTDHKRTEIVNKLKKAKDDLFNATSASEKSAKRREIETLKRKLFEYDKGEKIRRLKQRMSSIKSQYRLFKDKREEKKEEQQIINIKKEIEQTLDIAMPSAKDHFEWHINFSEVFQEKNGFDVVIANPPYVDSEVMTRTAPASRSMYSSIFKSASGNWDLFVVFIEKGIQILKVGGVVSYIVPNKLVAARYTEALRKILLKKDVKEIRDFSKVDVFKEVAVYPVVFFVQNKNEKEPVTMTVMKSLEEVAEQSMISEETFYKDTDWARYFAPRKILRLIIKISGFTPLGEYLAKISGAATVNEAYEIKKYLKELRGKSNGYKKLCNTGTIDRYLILWGKQKTQYIKSSFIKPILKHTELEKINPQRLKQANSEKIIIGGMTKELECAYDKGEFLAGKSTTIILADPQNKLPLKTILALLNSTLISFWYRHFFSSLTLAGGYMRISEKEIRQIPISKISKLQQNMLIKLVNKILAITKGDDYLRNQAKQAKVKQYERQIDQMVYKLYGLTKEEIKIVEDFYKGR